MKTEIVKIKGDWKEVVDDSRSTVGKPPLGKEPSTGFKQKILIAEHSPIRNIHVKWKWSGIKSWVATHWSRHKFEKYIKTQRTDRTGVDRNGLPQDALVDFTGDANAQNLIDAWRKRLCYQASPETREYAEDFKAALYADEPEISDVLVPNCVYRCGCPEMIDCPAKHFWTMCAENKRIGSTNIRERYKAYNEWFWEKRNVK